MQYSFFKDCEVEKKLSDFILKNHRLSMGPVTKEFENEFANWHKRKHCIMVNSGSSANLVLIASLLNLGILKKGESIGVNSVTWSTNIMPIIQLGLKPILIDVGNNDLNLNKENVETIIKDLKALFITNVLGLNYELNEISTLCKKHNVLFLEDNCEGLGCTSSGKLLGNFGFASTASSFIGHHFSTIEGGYIFTDNDQLAAMLKVVRAHGWTRNLNDEEKDLLKCEKVNKFNQAYTFEYCGFNVRPSEINAYCGLLQLDSIKNYNEIRKNRFEHISKKLNKYIYSPETNNPVFAIPIRTNNYDNKVSILKKLEAKGIESRPIISGSIGKQPFWAKEYGIKSLRNSSEIDNIGFYVTNDPQLEDEKFIYLINTLEELLND